MSKSIWVFPSVFQFTHPGRGATVITDIAGRQECVSIHAPREGCDISDFGTSLLVDVSIHAPREGCDTSMTIIAVKQIGFNSRTPGGVRLLPIASLV